ncbi:uncharacterized protein LOC115413690 [Sphaeramia orbicularis]|uniref:uncharacterized protein LOC115413690 n=1 Tax=Sphaeramia orbicularis TaxID=375764 RepID=UPI00117C50B7|nr:uncharacterized protein LOC115413690 [Sphaeramia orbicularis]
MNVIKSVAENRHDVSNQPHMATPTCYSITVDQVHLCFCSLQNMDQVQHTVLILVLALLCFKGFTEGNDVKQTRILWKEMGQTATMNCSHTKGGGYYQMYWYRQLPGQNMEQMVFTIANSKPDFEPDFRNDRFSTTKPDADSGTLTVRNLEYADTGVYFCSVHLCFYSLQNMDLQNMDQVQHTVLILVLAPLCFKGFTEGNDVKQTRILWKEMGQTATMNCSHTKGGGYFYMYWYRQLPGQNMEQMVLTIANSKPDFEPDFRNDRFSTTKPDADSGTLTVRNLEYADTGVYFCSVSQHSDTD